MGKKIIAQARAGTGKTATLAMASRVQAHQKILYLAYNKAIAIQARRKFGKNVDCRTLHSLAYAHTTSWMKERLAMPRQNGRMVAQLLRITQPLVIGAGSFDMPIDVRIGPHQLGRLTIETLRRYCYSADTELDWTHVPRLQGLTPGAQQHMAQWLLPKAQSAWLDVQARTGGLRYEHDYYLKMWALTNPQMGFDAILLDEAQDSNLLTARLIGIQDAQTVLVGDSAQQLYGWRGAIDSMNEFPDHEQLFLTQSWRFGPAIAELGNVFLRLRGTRPFVRGNPALNSRIVTDMIAPDAILCRTNAGAMEEVIGQLQLGRSTFLQGGGESIKRMAEAAIELQNGAGTNNAELCAFTSWGEVCDYVENDPGGQDLKAFVRLVETHGAAAIISACDQLANAPDDAVGRGMTTPPLGCIVISTMHRAKGLEWNKVAIASDVATPRVDAETWTIHEPDPAEMMLNYVAATRAQTDLCPGPLQAWRDL